MSLIDWSRFTPTQRAIMQVLKDGRPHRREELKMAFSDALCSDVTIRVHVFHINQKIRPLGQEIVVVFRERQRLYRWVRIISDE